MHSKHRRKRSRRRCRCRPPHTSASRPTAHENHDNGKTGPDATSLTVAKEGTRRGARGPQRRSPAAAAPRRPSGAEVSAGAGTTFASCTSSGGCRANSAAAGPKPFLGPDTPGKPLLSASTQPRQTCCKTPARSSPALPGVRILLGVRPYFPRVSRSPAQRAARSYTRAVCCRAFSFESHNPNESWT